MINPIRCEILCAENNDFSSKSIKGTNYILRTNTMKYFEQNYSLFIGQNYVTNAPIKQVYNEQIVHKNKHFYFPN